MTDRQRHHYGLLDTSVVIHLADLSPADVPHAPSISAITLAELSAGPLTAAHPTERAARQEVLQRTESTLYPIPFGVEAARAHGQISAAVTAIGRKPRGARAIDLLIAATAIAHGLPLYTRNPDDFVGLDHLIEIVAV
ncbi:type II toxin-antitoxin system VapC family toxin [Candidatus Poriferisodalis sp.]|uniref:type II toxin-antitoxin system VapC family toxin n=1 Tax=Candidatus Poriferisodalis sp. TaxID=3101277 RepID=UPI003C6F386A